MNNDLLDKVRGRILQILSVQILGLASAILALLLFGATELRAREADAKIVSITNPMQSNGIRIGDVLKRSITLEVEQPYQISKNAYPAKGTSRNGMELVDIKVESSVNGHATRYRLDLSYQVFEHAKTPIVMQLPSERLALTGGQKALAVIIPAWNFWFSPLFDGNVLDVKANLQPQLKPELVDIDAHRIRLWGFAGLLAVSLIVSVYLNADGHWLPFMGGAFAQAHRRIKHLPDVTGNERKALVYLHEAFNQTHGANLFAGDIEVFLAKRPAYSRMRQEIDHFFQRSNQVLFATPPHDRAAFIREMVILSKGLRDCERGVR